MNLCCLPPLGGQHSHLLECDYKANMEAAECVVKNAPEEEKPLEKIHTPGQKP